MQSGKDTFITLQRKPIKLLFYTLLRKDAGIGQNIFKFFNQCTLEIVCYVKQF